MDEGEVRRSSKVNVGHEHFKDLDMVAEPGRGLWRVQGVFELHCFLMERGASKLMSSASRLGAAGGSEATHWGEGGLMSLREEEGWVASSIDGGASSPRTSTMVEFMGMGMSMGGGGRARAGAARKGEGSRWQNGGWGRLTLRGGETGWGRHGDDRSVGGDRAPGPLSSGRDFFIVVVATSSVVVLTSTSP